MTAIHTGCTTTAVYMAVIQFAHWCTIYLCMCACTCVYVYVCICMCMCMCVCRLPMVLHLGTRVLTQPVTHSCIYVFYSFRFTRLFMYSCTITLVLTVTHPSDTQVTHDHNHFSGEDEWDSDVVEESTSQSQSDIEDNSDSNSFNDDDWIKVAVCEVQEEDGRWRQCTILELKTSNRHPTLSNVCLYFGNNEYEGLPPNTYRLQIDNNSRMNLYDSDNDKIHTRNIVNTRKYSI